VSENESEREIAVLDAGSAVLRQIAARLRRLGYSVLPAKTPDLAERLLRLRGSAIGAAVIPVDLPAFDLSAALRFLRRLEPTGELTFVATGQRPTPEDRRALRRAGVELALWEPVNDHVLRFQANRALASSEIVLGGRSSLRAPASWPVTVWAGDRRKPARVYSLSTSGAYLETPRPSLPGAKLRLDLPVPGHPIRLEARVVMTNVPGNLQRRNLPMGMGIQFKDPPPDAELVLTAWAQRRLAELGF
jgi:CheY-like chemotaxis protein